MPERTASNIAEPQGVGTGGALILVVGPSGVGKDTLLNAARDRLAGDARFVFPMRVITRADMIGEEHVAVTDGEFDALAESGEFLISWHAHGFGYGVPMAVKDELAIGRHVIVNTSRRVVNQASEVWPHAGVVVVTAEERALRGRLQSRGRESKQEIEERLARVSHVELPAGLRYDHLDNSGPLDQSIRRFMSILQSYAANG